MQLQEYFETIVLHSVEAILWMLIVYDLYCEQNLK